MTMKVRVLCVAAVLLATLWLGGCGHYVCGTTFGNATCQSSGSGISQGGGGNNITVTAIVYFTDPSSDQLAAEALNLAGSQKFATVSNFVSPIVPQGSNNGIVIVNKKYLYVLFGTSGVYGYAINPTTAALTDVTGNPFTSITGTSIAAEPTGQFLFIGDSTGITIYSVNASDGSLTAAGSASTGGIAPVQMATDGLGKYLYAVTGSEIFAYAYSSSGLTAVAGSPFTGSGFNMLQVTGESSGKYLLGTTSETGSGGGAVDNNVYAFSIGSGASAGALTALTPFATSSSPTFIAASPTQGYLYTFNETFIGTNNTQTLEPIQGFSLANLPGQLTPLSTSPFTTLLSTIGKFDQSGQYIFAIGQETNATAAGTLPIAVTTSTGALSSSLAHLGVPSYGYAVTDEP